MANDNSREADDIPERQGGRLPRTDWDGTSIQDFIVRDLAEVLLLLDNVSASSRANLPAAYKLTNPPFDQPANWIKEICEIDWPPYSINAMESAKILHARDALNEAARPATGRSIAFTLMVSEEDTGHRRRRSVWVRNLWRALTGRRQRNAPSSAAISARQTDIAGSDRAPSRSSLARMAFPGLAPQAAVFARSQRRMKRGFLALFLFTCYIAFDTATGNELLAHYNQDVAAIQKAIVAIGPADAGTEPYRIEETNVSAAKTLDRCRNVAPDPKGAIAPLFANCLRLKAADQARQADVRNIEHWNDGDFAFGGLRRVVTLGRSFVFRTGLATDIGAISVVLSVLGGSVLPILYGALGAAAAVIRTLVHRMKTSILTPGFMSIMWMQLLLGAVVGGCVGIFTIAPSDEGTSQGLLGTVHLSAAALCFLAGYGVESVFTALDSLLVRAFNHPSQGPNNPPS